VRKMFPLSEGGGGGGVEGGGGGGVEGGGGGEQILGALLLGRWFWTVSDTPLRGGSPGAGHAGGGGCRVEVEVVQVAVLWGEESRVL